MTERPDNVRLAGPTDEDMLYKLLCALEDDNGFGIPKSEAKVRAAIEKGTRRQGSMIGVIDGRKSEFGEQEPELAGSVCIVLDQVWYSDEWCLIEQWLFIRPEYRANHFDKDLFQFAKWCRSEMSKATDQDFRLMMSVTSQDRLPAKLRLWSRHGKQIGGIFAIQ